MRLTICAVSLILVGTVHAQTPLDTVRVEAKPLSPRMLEFEARRRSGEGQFVTQAEIETHNFVLTADVLRNFRERAGATLGAGCRRQYFVDDVPTYVKDINVDLPTPKEIAGVEYYVGPASIPLRYKTTSGAGFCGLVLIWTKDGS